MDVFGRSGRSAVGKWAAALYLFCLFTPAWINGNDTFATVWRMENVGLFYLLLGWFPVMFFMPTWLANPILVFCTVRLWRGQRVYWFFPVSALLLMFMINPLVYDAFHIQANEAYIGYYAWVASCVLVAARALIDEGFDRLDQAAHGRSDRR